MRLAEILVLVSACTINFTCGSRFPDYIKKCHLNDVQVKSCYKRAMEAIKSHLADGIPEFSLPPMDPLNLPLISLDNGYSFKAWFENIEIYHLTELRVHNVDINLEQTTASLQLTFPRLRIKSNYHIRGRILFLQLNGNGPADGNFTNVEVNVTLSGEQYKKQAKTYLKFRDLKFKETLHKPVFRFEGLFRNNPELTEQTNKIVNENIDEIVDELKPAIHVAVNQTVIGLISKMFKKFPVEELFPNY